MVNTARSLRRRTFRSANGPTLTEATMWREGTNDQMTLEIADGPPGVWATMLVGGRPTNHVKLNESGTGSIPVPALAAGTPISIVVGKGVLLTGHAPAAPGSHRPGH